MTSEQLRERTKTFALGIVHLFRSLPNSQQEQFIGTQLLRCGTLVGAKYRAVTHARSKASQIAKLGVVIAHAEESAYWLELLVESETAKEHKPETLLTEVRVLTAIFKVAQTKARKS